MLPLPTATDAWVPNTTLPPAIPAVPWRDLDIAEELPRLRRAKAYASHVHSTATASDAELAADIHAHLILHRTAKRVALGHFPAAPVANVEGLAQQLAEMQVAIQGQIGVVQQNLERQQQTLDRQHQMLERQQQMLERQQRLTDQRHQQIDGRLDNLTVRLRQLSDNSNRFFADTLVSRHLADIRTHNRAQMELPLEQQRLIRPPRLDRPQWPLAQVPPNSTFEIMNWPYNRVKLYLEGLRLPLRGGNYEKKRRIISYFLYPSPTAQA